MRIVRSLLERHKRWLREQHRILARSPDCEIRIEDASLQVLVRPFGDQLFEVAWRDINEALAFKRDLFLVDQICLDFATDAYVYRVNEEMIGWADLIAQLPTKLPGFPKYEEWFEGIAFPAFHANPTLLFRRPPSVTNGRPNGGP